MTRARTIIVALALASGLVLAPAAESMAAPTAQTGSCSADVALPPIVHFVTPSGGQSSTSLLGSWEGAWDGGLASRLNIEMVDGDRALILYSWGDYAPTNARRGWGRLWGTIQGNRLEFHSVETTRFAFTISDDLSSMTGERTFPNGTNYITMTRCQ